MICMPIAKCKKKRRRGIRAPSGGTPLPPLPYISDGSVAALRRLEDLRIGEI